MEEKTTEIDYPQRENLTFYIGFASLNLTSQIEFCPRAEDYKAQN